MPKQRKRSDYRTSPSDVRHEGTLSFTQYLVGPYTRGHDWNPDRPPSGVMRIHHGTRDSGVPKMRNWFLRWLDGDDVPEAVPGVKFEEVKRSIERARLDEPKWIAALELYQGRLRDGSGQRMNRVQFCIAYNIASDSTVTKWFNKAVGLVVDYLCDEYGRGRRE